MRKWLIVFLVLACGFFLFEPLIESYENKSTQKSTRKCADKDLYKIWQEKLKEKYGKKYSSEEGDDLANRICICINDKNNKYTDDMCECRESNIGIYTGSTRDAGSGGGPPDNLTNGCRAGYFKCSCCPNGGSKCKMGRTTNVYDHTCIQCKGDWHYTDNNIDLNTNSAFLDAKAGFAVGI